MTQAIFLSYARTFGVKSVTVSSRTSHQGTAQPPATLNFQKCRIFHIFFWADLLK